MFPYANLAFNSCSLEAKVLWMNRARGHKLIRQNSGNRGQFFLRCQFPHALVGEIPGYKEMLTFLCIHKQTVCDYGPISLLLTASCGCCYVRVQGGCHGYQ